MTSPIVQTPKKDRPLAEKTLYFTHLKEAPTGPIRPQSCMVQAHDVITCAEFQIEIFMGHCKHVGLIAPNYISII